MQILRSRHGFQADHSSSSYLFYAADHPVSAKGRQVAHRFSSRAEVDERTARYQKWGESDLSSDAYKALLTEHYDVMVSESYDWWTLMIAVPKTPALEALLRPFQDARGYNDQGVEVDDYGRRLAVVVYISFNYEGPAFDYREEDHLEHLAELLVDIRREILEGNVSFPQAVASFYGADDDEDDGEPEEEEPPAPASAPPLDANLSKVELQQECTARGISYRKSWNKDQLREALQAAQGPGAPPAHAGAVAKGPPAKLSHSARVIVDSLDRA
jgi:hypothetical protein